MDNWIVEDRQYMQQALKLAEKGWGKTNPNPLVGAVIAKGEEIISQGYHGYYGGPHAEAVALEKAGEKAKGATMYVTLEPCNHHGKTPPCTDNIIKAGIQRVVIAALDPSEKMAGKSVRILRQAGVKVEVGLLEGEANRQNEIFRKYITTNHPFVIAKWGMSLDGKIATKTGDSRWITSEQARLDGHKTRARVSAIMVGSGTIKIDDPLLTCRHPNYQNHHPIRVVVDSNLSITKANKVITSVKETSTIIATTDETINDLENSSKITELKNIGVELVSVPSSSEGRVKLDQLMKVLGEKGIDSILVEGGETFHGSLVTQGLIDKYEIYLGNLAIGGADAPTPVGGQGVEYLSNSVTMENLECQSMGKSIKITAYPSRSESR